MTIVSVVALIAVIGIVIALLALGIAVAVLIERRALAAGRWAYTERMPLVPVLEVGLVPVLRMVILLPLVLSLVAVWFNEHPDRRPG